MKNILLKIRYYGVCIIIGAAMAIMIISWYIFPNRYKKRIRTLWGKSQVFLLKKPTLEGEFCEDTDLYLINHRSGLDILIIESVTTQDLAWVAKKSISKIPFFGRIVTKGDMIAVDRESKTSMIGMIKNAKQKLKEGRVITVFPEGTRSSSYQMLEFKAGAEALANILKLKVQGIVLTNTREILDLQNGTFSRKPQIKIRVLPQIQADKKTNWYKELRKNMQDNVDELAKSDNNR
jgi:1-acyl-sn-glycerol-3-phosphate acyltransferase